MTCNLLVGPANGSLECGDVTVNERCLWSSVEVSNGCRSVFLPERTWVHFDYRNCELRSRPGARHSNRRGAFDKGKI